MTEYITVCGESVAEYNEKRSRFIARVLPCCSEEEASRIIAESKSRFWDARHNVYAYILQNGASRFSDDGEPHSTAGKPVFDVISGSGITDVIIVVTRYFGGVLLGTGGLVRAYSTSAKDAVAAAQLVRMCPGEELSVCCEYSDHQRLSSLIERFGGAVNNTDFTDKVEIYFSLEQPSVVNFEDAICEMFSSRLKVKHIKEKFFAVKI